MVTAALSWLSISIVSAIPLILIPYNKEELLHMDALSAFFESMSGWTGTGLTMVDKENLCLILYSFGVLLFNGLVALELLF